MRVIAIDGPSGSGKSTVARTLAERLGLDYLDTGAMYRAVAFAALRRGVDPDDTAAVAGFVDALDLVPDGPRITVDGVDASVDIRGPEVTAAVSFVARNPAVRRSMVRRQRAWISDHGGGVVEGRDIGTEVWPDAELKVFLTADIAVRAARRGEEIGHADTGAVAADLVRRDTIDSSRAVSPLTQADDAVVVDTTDCTIDDIVEHLLQRLAS